MDFGIIELVTMKVFYECQQIWTWKRQVRGAGAYRIEAVLKIKSDQKYGTLQVAGNLKISLSSSKNSLGTISTFCKISSR